MTRSSRTLPAKFRFVFFDLDGTLYDMVAAIDAALQVTIETACNRLGKDQKQAPFYLQRFWQEYSSDSQAAELLEPVEWLRLLFYRTLDLGPIGKEAALAEQLVRQGINEFRQRMKPFPPVRKLLDQLQQQQIGCGIISNGTSKWQRPKLEVLGLDKYFPAETLFFPDEQGVRKPDPKIFQSALENCGVQAREAIFVGDSPVTDVPGALAVGMTVIWLNRYQLTAPAVGHLPGRLLEARSFSEVATIIGSLSKSDQEAL